jgi:hypothetical protein
MNTAFSIEAYRAEYESFHEDCTSRWNPCEVIGIVVKDDDAAYVVRLPARGGVETVTVVDYVRTR